MRNRIDTRQEAVAELDGRKKRIVQRLARLAEEVQLAPEPCAVAAHHRLKDAVLHPARVELAERLSLRALEPAEVVTPVGIPGKREVESARYICFLLTAKEMPWAKDKS